MNLMKVGRPPRSSKVRGKWIFGFKSKLVKGSIRSSPKDLRTKSLDGARGWQYFICQKI